MLLAINIYHQGEIAEFRTFAELLENIIIPKATHSLEYSVESRILSKKQACRLNLDDAVSVLGNLTLTAFSSSSSSVSIIEVEYSVQCNVRQSLFSVGYRLDRKIDARSDIRHGMDESHKKIRRGKRGRGEGGQSKKPIPPSLRKQFCFDCGDENYYAGDLRCKFSSKYTMTKRRSSPAEKTPFQAQRQQNVSSPRPKLRKRKQLSCVSDRGAFSDVRTGLEDVIQFWTSDAHAASEVLKLWPLCAMTSVSLSSCDFGTGIPSSTGMVCTVVRQNLLSAYEYACGEFSDRKPRFCYI